MLAEDTKQNKTEIRELRQQLDNLTATVQRLAFELQRRTEHEAHEREKFVLKVENQLLKSGRQLPPPDDDGQE